MLKSLLSSHTGRIYAYLANKNISQRFLKDQKRRIYIYQWNKSSTKVHKQYYHTQPGATINYVGFVGRVAFWAANRIGNQVLVKIDYREFLKQSE